MNYFIIVFFAFFSVLCGYIWILESQNTNLLKEVTTLKTILNSQNLQNKRYEIRYKFIESQNLSKNKRIEVIRLRDETCEAELKSYKELINAF